MSIYLGVDIGTTKICALALDVDTGELKSVVSLPSESKITFPEPGKSAWAEQNPVKIQQVTVTVLKKLVQELSVPVTEIKGMGFTGQMHGMLIVNDKLQPLSNLITWQDRRSEEIYPGTQHTYIREIFNLTGGEDKFYSTGSLPATGYLGMTLFWLKTNRQLPGSKFKVTLIHDWLPSRFCQAETIYTDITDAGSTGIFDIINRTWDWDIIHQLGLPGESLPEIKEAGSIIGYLNEDIAMVTGLPKGIPICCALGDNQASMYGSLDDYATTVLVNIGTGSQVSLIVDEFSRVPTVDTRYFPYNKYALVGASLSGGQVYQLLEQFYREIGTVFWQVTDSTSLYNQMNELAAQAGESTLRCEPNFFGTRSNPGKQGLITGLTVQNFTVPHLCRAVLAGMVDELYNYYTKMVGTDFSRYQTVICTGNGTKKNPVLCNLISDRFNMPVKLTQYDEEAAYGAALIAAVNCNRKYTLDQLNKIIKYNTL